MVKTIVSLVGYILILAVSVVWAYNLGSVNFNKDSIRDVKAYCDMAHNEVSGESEEKCGQLQDETNTEYLCSYNYTECWLEVK